MRITPAELRQSPLFAPSPPFSSDEFLYKTRNLDSKKNPENGAGKESNKLALSKCPWGDPQGIIKLNEFRVFL
jgi:hypothetical protein